MINKSNIGELTIEQKDFRITIKQKEENVTQVVTAAPQPAIAYQAVPQQQQGRAESPAAGAPAQKKEDVASSNHLTIKSPMIGTFYRRSSPEKPNLVEVGDEIIPGKVVCIIEAMKLFNEIESEIKGRIVKVLVDDASPVEYDQPLFLVEPI